jgi:hypothetical protein
MKKISALLPAALLAVGMFATPAAADDTDPRQLVADPGVTALRGAFAAFREARAAEDACRGAGATDQCKNARSAARAAFQTVRADAVVAHQQFVEKVRTWTDAKTPDEKAVIAADLAAEVEAAKSVIDAHRDDITALRGKLDEQLASLDPKLRDQVRRDALAIEAAIHDKNTAELTARLHEAAARYAPLLAELRGGATSGKPGTAPNTGTRPLPTLPPGFVIPSNLPLPPGLLQQLQAPRPSGSTEVHTPQPLSTPAR